MIDGRTWCVCVLVHVDDIFSIGEKSRCVQFGHDLHESKSITYLGELRLFVRGVRFPRDRDLRNVRRRLCVVLL